MVSYSPFLFYMYQFVIARTVAQVLRPIENAGAVTPADPFPKVAVALIGTVEHHVHASLVYSHRVKTGYDTDIFHLRFMRMRVAITIHAQIIHHINIYDFTVEMVYYGSGSLSHCIFEFIHSC